VATVTIGGNSGDDHSGTEDCFLKQADSSSSYDTGTSFEVTKYGANDHSHGAVKFSGIDSLPDSLAVSSATLYLYQEANGGVGAYNVVAKKFERDWVIGETSWDYWKTTGGNQSWTTGGALHETDDRSSTTTFDVSVDMVNESKSFSTAQLATDVEDMADGGHGNYGWHLERGDSGEDTDWKRFTSIEGSDGNRPYLSVTYTEPSAGNIIPHLIHRQFMARR